jgi:pimeloyl-ACP methyl ester carboxylesterase
LPIGYFGASTGGAAALWSAAETEVHAVVSRGGRIDLAGPRLASVTAPTLLIVGERDTDVLRFSRESQQALRCPNQLEIIAGATHLFPESGALEQVAELARNWFLDTLPRT